MDIGRLLGVMLESAGVPVPGETVLVTSGVLVQQAHLDLGDAIIFGILGAVVGAQIGYWVARGVVPLFWVGDVISSSRLSV
ncbi:MAG: hypothetical protein M3305_09210 [Actinomycetota bacterium]|nr:hypothetical protein [Actinomycetota bacterium]